MCIFEPTRTFFVENRFFKIKDYQASWLQPKNGFNGRKRHFFLKKSLGPRGLISRLPCICQQTIQISQFTSV